MTTWGGVIDLVADPGMASYERPARFGPPTDPYAAIYGLPGWSKIYEGAVGLDLYGFGNGIPEMVQAITGLLKKRYSTIQLRRLMLSDVACFLQEELTSDLSQNLSNHGESTTNALSTRSNVKRGRKPEYDFEKDKQVSKAWKTGSYRNYKDFAPSVNLTSKQVKQTLDRQRKRDAKARE